MNRTLVGIAVLAGMVIGVPLYLFIVNNLFYKGNNAKDVIPAYIKNSVELRVVIPKRDPFDPNTLLTFKHSTYESIKTKDGDGYLYLITFYSSAYKKYFVIRLFDYANTFYPHQIMEKKDVIITVNKNDLNNVAYGSKTVPVPVFKYRGVTPIIYNDVNYDITESEYLRNVTQYLTFFMPKDEFKKQFGNDNMINQNP